MTNFRGVDKQEILDSISAAAEFLTSLNIGPETQSLIDELGDKDALKEIQKATSEDDLQAALDTLAYPLTYLVEALNAHAQRDTDGKGQEIRDNLMKWGALDGFRSDSLDPSDQEIEKHIEALSHETLSMELDTDKPIQTYLVAPVNPSDLQTANEMERVRMALGRNFAGYMQAGEMEWSLKSGSIIDPATGNPREGVLINATEDAAKDIANVFAQHTNRYAEVDLEIVDAKNQAVSPPSAQDRERVRREQDERKSAQR